MAVASPRSGRYDSSRSACSTWSTDPMGTATSYWRVSGRRILSLATTKGGGRVYPSRFEYCAPTTVDEALSILERYGDDAKVLAGGQSLIPLMKLRFAAPRALVDINRIPGLDRLEEHADGLRIGALVRHKTCEHSQLLH